MARLVLLGDVLSPSTSALPALALLPHRVDVLPGVPGALVDLGDADVVLVDCLRDLVAARALCRLLRTTAPDTPVLAVLTEGGLAAVSGDWGVTDVVLHDAGPAEVDARVRLAAAAVAPRDDAADGPGEIVAGDVVIDESTYTARVRRTVLDLTYKEFELLKFLAAHPGRVFTRAQLLQEVWGYDYFGGTRTVDVHVRRLRAKLGAEHEHLIGTVRNVGYRLVVGRAAVEDDATD
ncbi:winged helix-turn-helix transcriptional regulator [Aquipuribacter sp. SD81]|uniref:winged helix-turn-helix transcriptional regulator n=1 Tax=Aquipuribacter sp. SD81 TaxID=3127703 RepID=UPI00301AD7D8